MSDVCPMPVVFPPEDNGGNNSNNNHSKRQFSDFHNTPAIHFSHFATPRYGMTSDILNLATGTREQGTEYLYGLVAGSITVSVFVVLWSLLLIICKIRCSQVQKKKVLGRWTFLSGTRPPLEMLVPPKNNDLHLHEEMIDNPKDEDNVPYQSDTLKKDGVKDAAAAAAAATSKEQELQEQPEESPIISTAQDGCNTDQDNNNNNNNDTIENNEDFETQYKAMLRQERRLKMAVGLAFFVIMVASILMCTGGIFHLRKTKGSAEDFLGTIIQLLQGGIRTTETLKDAIQTTLQDMVQLMNALVGFCPKLASIICQEVTVIAGTTMVVGNSAGASTTTTGSASSSTAVAFTNANISISNSSCNLVEEAISFFNETIQTILEPVTDEFELMNQDQRESIQEYKQFLIGELDGFCPKLQSFLCHGLALATTSISESSSSSPSLLDTSTGSTSTNSCNYTNEMALLFNETTLFVNETIQEFLNGMQEFLLEEDNTTTITDTNATTATITRASLDDFLKPLLKAYFVQRIVQNYLERPALIFLPSGVLLVLKQRFLDRLEDADGFCLRVKSFLCNGLSSVSESLLIGGEEDNNTTSTTNNNTNDSSGTTNDCSQYIDDPAALFLNKTFNTIVLQDRLDNDALEKYEKFLNDLIDMVEKAEFIQYTFHETTFPTIAFLVFTLLLIVISIFMLCSLFLFNPSRGYNSREWRIAKMVVYFVFIFLVILSFVLTLVSMIGSTVLADGCIDSPDPRIMSIVSYYSNQFNVQVTLSPFIAEFLATYLSKCSHRPGKFQQVLESVVDGSNSLANIDLSKSNIDFTRLQMICGSDPNDTMELFSNVLNKTSEKLCTLSQFMATIADIFSCTTWYPLYEKLMYNTLCYSTGTVAYIACTQFVVVFMALIIVTCRVVIFDELPIIQFPSRKNHDEDDDDDDDDDDGDDDVHDDNKDKDGKEGIDVKDDEEKGTTDTKPIMTEIAEEFPVEEAKAIGDDKENSSSDTKPVATAIAATGMMTKIVETTPVTTDNTTAEVAADDAREVGNDDKDPPVGTSTMTTET